MPGLSKFSGRLADHKSQVFFLHEDVFHHPDGIGHACRYSPGVNVKRAKGYIRQSPQRDLLFVIYP